MNELSAVKMVVKRSRFFAHLYLLDSPEEIERIIKIHRRQKCGKGNAGNGSSNFH